MKYINRFKKYLIARHRIYNKRLMKTQPPFTTDKILREYKFTNVFRELDAVSQDLIKHLNSHSSRTPAEILFNICAYRMFNVPDTWLTITEGNGWIKNFDYEESIKLLDDRQDRGEQVFTGAYLMTGGAALQGERAKRSADENGRVRKHRHFLGVVDKIWEARKDLTKRIVYFNSIEYAVDCFSEYEGIAGFIGYEFATDLTYTKVLDNAKDLMTWANPGPGAVRGLNRLYGRPFKQSLQKHQAIEEMRTVLAHILRDSVLDMPDFWLRTFNMRDVEHSLCEFDKYERVRLGEGRPRSKFSHS